MSQLLIFTELGHKPVLKLPFSFSLSYFVYFNKETTKLAILVLTNYIITLCE